jgi:general secretion pathway protein G
MMMYFQRTLVELNDILNHSNSEKQKNRRQSGFSILEILIALTILGIVSTFVVGKVFDQLEEAKVRSAHIQIQNLSKSLMEFRRHCGFYPETEQGLDSLVQKPTGGKECKRYHEGGYLQDGKVPLDPWDNEFVYTSNGQIFEIISYGKDGIEGGESAFDKDISSKDKAAF